MYCRKPKNADQNNDPLSWLDDLTFNKPQLGISYAHLGVDSFGGIIHTDKTYYVGMHPEGILFLIPKNQPFN